jgi:hypothetical protein
MAICKKNSGIYRQDGVLAKFTADARIPQQVSLIVAQALAAGKKRQAYLEARAKNQDPRTAEAPPIA